MQVISLIRDHGRLILQICHSRYWSIHSTFKPSPWHYLSFHQRRSFFKTFRQQMCCSTSILASWFFLDEANLPKHGFLPRSTSRLLYRVALTLMRTRLFSRDGRSLSDSILSSKFSTLRRPTEDFDSWCTTSVASNLSSFESPDSIVCSHNRAQWRIATAISLLESHFIANCTYKVPIQGFCAHFSLIASASCCLVSPDKVIYRYLRFSKNGKNDNN